MSDKATQFVEHYGDEQKYMTPIQLAFSAYDFGFCRTPKKVATNGMKPSVIEDAQKAVSDTSRAKVEAEKNFLLSHGFQVVIDYSKEIVLWRAPEGYGSPTNLYQREYAVTLVIDALRSAKYYAEQEIKELKKQHGIGDECDKKQCGGGE